MRTLIAIVLTLAAGCGFRQDHLSPGFGESYDAALLAQRAHPDRTPAAAVSGLDPQEAAIISEGYRRRLAPKGQKVNEDPLIYLEQQSGLERPPPPLAPSVPRG